MRRRRKRRSSSKRWLWMLGALAVAAVAYLFLRQPRGSTVIPVPGEAARWVETPLSPREEIRDSDREALDRVLRERSRPR